MPDANNQQPPVIEVRNLAKIFVNRKRKPGFWGSVRGLFAAEREEIRAVDDVSFTIRRGELVGYLGPNGAGKSTTIKMLTGILQPSQGSIAVAGVDPQRDRRVVTAQIGVVFGQKTQLWWDLPVGESYDLLRTIYRIERKDYEERMEFFKDLLGIGDFMRQQTRKLSLGQRMRADLAASLLHDPPVLFLDEPTIGLDILTREAIRDFIKELNRERQTTIILTTHDMQDIEFLASRLILLDRGRVHYDGPYDDFMSKHAPEKIVSLGFEKSSQALDLSAYDVVARPSTQHVEIRLGSNESIAPLIESFTRQGARIRDVNVRKQDLADTLKDMYSGQKVEL